MPGLYCPSSWTPLPLTDSWVRACANGPCFSLRARLTYHNPQAQPVDGEARRGRRALGSRCGAKADAARAPAPGVFVYPLAEAEVVSGFEAEAAGRRVSFQLQSRRRSQGACCRALGPALGASMPRRCAQGESGETRPPTPQASLFLHLLCLCPAPLPPPHPTPSGH